MPRVVFYAFTKANLVEHFQIKSRALLDARSLNQFAGFNVEIHPIFKLVLNFFHGPHRGLTWRHVMAGWVNRVAGNFIKHLASQRVEQGNRFNLVIEQGNAHRGFIVLCRKHIDHVAAHTECASAKIKFVSIVLHAHQTRDHVALRDFFTLLHVQDHAMVINRIAYAVNSRNGGNDNTVFPLQQSLSSGEAHLFYVLINAGIFFYEQIAGGHVSFRLVIIVIRNEILHRIVRKKLPELTVQLRCQGFIGRHDDCWPPRSGDHISHGVGFT